MSNNNEFTPPTFTFTNSISKNFALPMAEIVVDKIVFANEAFTQLTGYSHKDLEKMNFSGLLSHSVRDSIMEVLNSIHKVSLFSYTTIAPIIKKDGFDTLCEIKFDFLERDGIKSVLASFKEQNQSKGINLSPLISEKLDSIKRLSASLSHEINNPLNVIVNYLYIIENTKDEEKRKGYIKTIYQEVERIAGILNWLLDFSSYIHGEISAVDVNEEIKRAIELVENDFSSKNISIFFNTCEDCIVPFTEGQLQRAILNLLLNAKDAIKENDRQSKVVINGSKILSKLSGDMPIPLSRTSISI